MKLFRKEETNVQEITQTGMDVSRLAQQHATKKSTLRARLVSLLGPQKGSSIPIEENNVQLSIGRSFGNDVVVVDGTVSSFHAVIQRQRNGTIVLKDLSSTNGTFVDGSRVKEKKLIDGDHIFLGRDTLFKFESGTKDEESLFASQYDYTFRDGLTGAFNKRSLESRLNQSLSLCRRHQLGLGLIMFGLDELAAVRETHGPEKSDHLLVEICEAMFKELRSEDLLSRFAIDNFAVIAMGCDFKGVQVLAKRLRHGIRDAVLKSTHPEIRALAVSLRMGCVSCVSPGQVSTWQLLQIAEKNLFEAKHNQSTPIVACKFQS